MWRLVRRTVCQSEGATVSLCSVARVDDEDGLQSALACPKIASHHSSGNLMDSLHSTLKAGDKKKNSKEENKLYELFTVSFSLYMYVLGKQSRFSDVWPRYHFTCVLIIGNN